MSGETYEEIRILNEKIDELLIVLDKLKSENENLKVEKEFLLKDLESKGGEIERLKESNEKFKLSGALLGDDDNAEEAKRKIGEIIREIDKCVALIDNNI